MRINSISLQNFRCFEQIKVDFHPELTVLVAPNAGGKTALLDAIVVALSPVIEILGDAKGKGIQESDAREKLVQADDLLLSMVPAPFQEIVMEATGMMGDKSVMWRLRKSTPEGVATISEMDALSDSIRALRKQLSEDHARIITLPVVAYYGTRRLLGLKSSAIEEKRKPIQARTQGYEGCLVSGTRFDAFLEWYTSASFSIAIESMRRKEATPDRRLLRGGCMCVENAVHYALKSCYGKCWLHYDTTRREAVLDDPERNRRLPLSIQSDGVKAIVSLVGDLATRAWLLNPQFGENAAKETPGIVLIDEVDMHLHPKWQQGVVQSLRDAFPKVQFILTTHSPQVLSTVDNESIRILQQDGDQWYAEEPDEQTSGGESSYIMATVMGASEIPDSPITQKMNDYTILIEQGKWASEHAVNLRNELDKHYGTKHPRILDCDRLIRFQSFKAKRGEAS